MHWFACLLVWLPLVNGPMSPNPADHGQKMEFSLTPKGWSKVQKCCLCSLLQGCYNFHNLQAFVAEGYTTPERHGVCGARSQCCVDPIEACFVATRQLPLWLCMALPPSEMRLTKSLQPGGSANEAERFDAVTAEKAHAESNNLGPRQACDNRSIVEQQRGNRLF